MAGPEAHSGAARGCTVLLVEDNEVVMKVARLTLERAGYDVLAAEDGNRAVELFRDNAGRIDAVVLDLGLPGLSGERAFEEMQRGGAGVPFLLSSGHSEQDALDRLLAHDNTAFMQKPYRPAVLLESLAALMSGGAAAGR